MIKKNQFVLIFLTIVTILAVWYIKTPLDAKTSGDATNEEEISENTRTEKFEKMRSAVRDERSLEVAGYDNILASEEASISEKEVALNAKKALSSLTEQEVLAELEIMNLGYVDAFVHASSYGIEVNVIADELSVSKANEIILLTIATFDTSYDSVVVNFTSQDN